MKKLLILIMLCFFISSSFAQWDVNIEVSSPVSIQENDLKIYGENISMNGSDLLPDQNFNLGMGLGMMIEPNIAIYHFPIYVKMGQFTFNVTTPYIFRKETFNGIDYKNDGFGDLLTSISYKNYTTRESSIRVDWENFQKIKAINNISGDYRISWRELEDVEYYFCLEASDYSFQDARKTIIRDNNFLRIQNQPDGIWYYRIYAVFNDGEKIESDIHKVSVKRKRIKGIFQLGLQLPTGKVNNKINDYILPLGSGTTNYFAEAALARRFKLLHLKTTLGIKYMGVYQYKTFYSDPSQQLEQFTNNSDYDGLLLSWGLYSDYLRFKKFPMGIDLYCVYSAEGKTKYKQTTTYQQQSFIVNGEYKNLDDFFISDLVFHVSYKLLSLINLRLNLRVPVFSKFNNAFLNHPEREIVIYFGLFYH